MGLARVNHGFEKIGFFNKDGVFQGNHGLARVNHGFSTGKSRVLPHTWTCPDKIQASVNKPYQWNEMERKNNLDSRPDCSACKGIQSTLPQQADWENTRGFPGKPEFLFHFARIPGVCPHTRGKVRVPAGRVYTPQYSTPVCILFLLWLMCLPWDMFPQVYQRTKVWT